MEPPDPLPGDDPTIERFELRGEGVDNACTAPLDDGPAQGVGQHGEQEPEHAGEGSVEREHRVGRGPGDDGPGLDGAESGRQSFGRREAFESEERRGDGTARESAQWGEEVRQDTVHVSHEGGKHPPVGGAVHAEVRCGLGDGARDGDSFPSVERLHEGDQRREEVDAPAREIRAAEERGGAEEGVDRRADVVMEPGQGQFLGPAASSDCVRPFDDVDSQSGAGHCQRCGEPVGPRAHDDGIGPPHRDITARAPACRRPR